MSPEQSSLTQVLKNANISIFFFAENDLLVYLAILKFDCCSANVFTAETKKRAWTKKKKNVPRYLANKFRKLVFVLDRCLDCIKCRHDGIFQIAVRERKKDEWVEGENVREDKKTLCVWKKKGGGSIEVKEPG